MYSEMAKAHPSLERGMVWCRTCGRSERIDSAACLRSGWPICHGETMTIDHPSTWIEIKDGPHRIELNDLLLCKHADPTEGAREDLSPDEAREIAAEDPSLIYLDIRIEVTS